jgi:hypothetical protein
LDRVALAGAGDHKSPPYVPRYRAPLIGAKIRSGGVVANSSPPPCGEGMGVGVVRRGTAVPCCTTPTPFLPPTRGEGVPCGIAAP